MGQIQHSYSFKRVIEDVGQRLLREYERGSRVGGKWQGLDPKAKMVEIMDYSFKVMMPAYKSQLVSECNPDLRWANEHFKERVEGKPTNPGRTYKMWPYYKEDSYREGGKFTHTYQERFWPQFAGDEERTEMLKGVRYNYGDLEGVIRLLSREPDTRQAFLPIWFPEDTGVEHGGRVPCTLGYLFRYKEGYLHMTYYIRSCDYIRHFRNDIYMAGLLLDWVLQEIRGYVSPLNWGKVELGALTMHISSMHMFESDIVELKKRLK